MHKLLPIGPGLHPAEVVIVAAAVAEGRWVRRCTCGTFVVGVNEVDLYCRWKEHRRAEEGATR